MFKFGVSFNYKNEKRNAFLHLMIPAVVALPLILFTIGVYEPDWDESPEFLQWAGPELLRDNICISVTMSFSIFIRSLYIRFAALNTLLRSHMIFIDFPFFRLHWPTQLMSVIRRTA